jgi:hypothetical protein
LLTHRRLRKHQREPYLDQEGMKVQKKAARHTMEPVDFKERLYKNRWMMR